MFPIFEPPFIIAFIIIVYILFFAAIFSIKVPEKTGRQQINSEKSKETAEETTRTAEKSHLECTMFGFLQQLPKGDPIPDECMGCKKLVECLMKKSAFDWYSGENSSKKSEP
jgi:hypothetical protein